jgi:hypothetical protein
MLLDLDADSRQTTQTPDSIDPRLIQARNLQKHILHDIQTRVASKLVDITAELGQLSIIDEWMRNGLNEQQTVKAKQLVVVNSMLSSLDRLPTELTSTEMDVLNEELPTEQQEADPGGTAQPDPAQAWSSFQDINWDDVQPFHPAAAAPPVQTTTYSATDVQDQIDSIVQASTPAVPPHTPSRSSPKDTSELPTPDFESSSLFMGMLCFPSLPHLLAFRFPFIVLYRPRLHGVHFLTLTPDQASTTNPRAIQAGRISDAGRYTQAAFQTTNGQDPAKDIPGKSRTRKNGTREDAPRKNTPMKYMPRMDLHWARGPRWAVRGPRLPDLAPSVPRAPRLFSQMKLSEPGRMMRR